MSTTPSPDPDMHEPRYVSTARAADALGVSTTTVKRWVDEGVLPAHRTVGKHRKVLVADLLRLARDGQLPRADLSRLFHQSSAATAAPDAVCQRLLSAVTASDLDAISGLIHGAYQSGMAIETLADAAIAPVLRRVGHEWQSGRIEVMHEHRVTQAFVAALYILAGLLRGSAERNRPVAIGGAPEHDHSILPTLLAKLSLLDAGWDAIDLGPHTPFSAFRAAIDEFQPKLIWLSASHIADPDAFPAEHNAFFLDAQTRGVAVAVGGQALVEPLRRQLHYTTFGDGLTHLAAFARSLHVRPQRPQRGRTAGRR
jgi:excisionase family DNA binding protein